MILMYHKIDTITPTRWWIHVEDFRRHLDQLHWAKFVYLSDYDPANPLHVCLTFDDGYECVYRHAFPLLLERGIPFEVFVIGSWIGGDNRLDSAEPLARIAGWNELAEMSLRGGRIQWHTRDHRNLLRLDATERSRQLMIPTEIRACFPSPHLSWFSYPYGMHDEEIVALVKGMFEGAVSVDPPAEQYLRRHSLPRFAITDADLSGLLAPHHARSKLPGRR